MLNQDKHSKKKPLSSSFNINDLNHYIEKNDSPPLVTSDKNGLFQSFEHNIFSVTSQDTGELIQHVIPRSVVEVKSIQEERFKQKWIATLGGPLILIPRSALASWAGDKGDDYDADGLLSHLAIASITIGTDQGLVLATPELATLVDTPTGIAILRWGCADSEEEMLATVRSTAEAAPVLETLKFCAVEEEYVLIDSVYSGIDFPESILVRLEVGSYEIVTISLDQGPTNYWMHVFQKEKS